MNANVGGFDRLIRLIAGSVLLFVGIFVVDSSGLSVLLETVGAIMLLTGIFRFCPAYLPFKASTCQKKESTT